MEIYLPLIIGVVLAALGSVVGVVVWRMLLPRGVKGRSGALWSVAAFPIGVGVWLGLWFVVALGMVGDGKTEDLGDGYQLTRIGEAVFVENTLTRQQFDGLLRGIQVTPTHLFVELEEDKQERVFLLIDKTERRMEKVGGKEELRRRAEALGVVLKLEQREAGGARWWWGLVAVVVLGVPGWVGVRLMRRLVRMRAGG